MNGGFLILIAIAFGLMWFLLIRPQRRRQNEQLAMQQNVSPGDEVVTAGGIYGTVDRLDEDEVALEVAEGVVVRVARRAIAGVMPRENAEELEDEGEEGLADEAAVERSEAKPS